MALRTGREETASGMGLHRISQLNDIEAAGGVASFCSLLNSDIEAVQVMALEVVANLIALQNGAGNELSAGESVAQSGACMQLVKLMGSRALNLQQGKSMRPEVERKALRVVFHICKSPACQNALRRAGGSVRLLELLSTDSPAALETRVEAARCLKRFVYQNPENIADLTANNGVKLLCELLGDFIELEGTNSMVLRSISPGYQNERVPRDESKDVAIEAILRTICECINMFDGGFGTTIRAIEQIPAPTIRSFVSVLQNSDRMNRMLASQVLTKASREPSLVFIMANEKLFIQELMWMLDSDEDYTIASEILHGLCSTSLKQTEVKTEGGAVEGDAHANVLRIIFDLEVFDVVLNKLNACVIGEDQFIGEIRFQENLLGITKSFSAEAAAYADYICSHGCVRTLSAFLLSPRKQPLVPVCAQTLMNLCEFNPAIFDELYDRNASDFFHRMLQTPPDESRLSALRYFQSLLSKGKCISAGVLDTLFLMASGRDSVLKTKSLEVIAQLTGVKSLSTLMEPLEPPPSPEHAELVLKLKDRVVGIAYFPTLMGTATTVGDGEMRSNAIKCIRCAIDGGEDFVANMLDQEVLRAFWLGMRRSMDTPMDSLSPIDLEVNRAIVQLLYLILSSSSAKVDGVIGDQVTNLVAVVTEFIVSQPSRLPMGIRIIRLFVSHEPWKVKFFDLLVDSTTMGIKFMEALMNGIEQSISTALESGKDGVFDDSLAVLTALVDDTKNEATVNLVISGRVHISLLEFLKEDASSYVVVSALTLLDSLTQTRRIRLLVLEAGPALKPLVSMYESTTKDFEGAEPTRKEIATRIGKILVHLASDPLEFRKTLYDHRDVLPRIILGNILSPAEAVSSTAEEIVLLLVESDFATCPLWIDLIETVNVQLVFQVLAASKKSSVQVTAVRKLVDIVFSHPEILENEETGLSAIEKNTLVTMLITFFVDFDPRTSVVGVLALALLLKNGQQFNHEQMEKIAVDGAVSLVYWIQKGTERHQENAVNILFDGISDPELKLKFFRQLQSPSVQRDAAFTLELALQLLDSDESADVDGMFKRCSLLVGILELTEFSSLSKECTRTLTEVAILLLTMIGRETEEETKQQADESAPPSLSQAFAMTIIQFLTLVVGWPVLRAKLVKKNALEQVVVLFKQHKRLASTNPGSKVIADAARSLIKALCIDDIPKLVSLNVIDIMLEFPSGQDAETLSLGDVESMLDTMNAIADCGAAGKAVLMDTDGVLANLESAFALVMGNDDNDLKAQFVTGEDSSKKLDLACRIASLVTDFSRSSAYREKILLASRLCGRIFALMEWLPSIFEAGEVESSAVAESFSVVFTAGLPFIEILIISEFDKITIAQIERILRQALSTFVDGHKSRDMYIDACSALVVLYESSRARRELGVAHLESLEPLLKDHALRCLKAEVFSLECVIAMLELANVVFAADLIDDKVIADRNSWILAVVLDVLFKSTEWNDTLDISVVISLLTRCCVSASTRRLLTEHLEYHRLLEVIGYLANDDEWKRYHRRAIKLLELLGEEDAILEASAVAERQQSNMFRRKNNNSMTSQSSLGSTTDAPNVRQPFTIRCFHCRQAVRVASNSNLLSVNCPSCQQNAAESTDTAAASLHALSSVNEVASASSEYIHVDLDEKESEGTAFDHEASSPPNSDDVSFKCVNCEKMLQLPSGINSDEVVCPHCMHLAATRKTRNTAAPGLHESESIESGQSTPKSSNDAAKPPSSSSSLPGIDVRDTKVVSCGHCGKHLIVKNGASAVKCPACEGISKLSSTTSTLENICFP